MKLLRITLGLALMAAPLVTVVMPAAAATPLNDLRATATPITAGYTSSIDTTGATSDPEEVSMAASCGLPEPSSGVWYTYVADRDGDVNFGVRWEDPQRQAWVAVAQEVPVTNWLDACGAGVAQWYATAGTTYFILVFDLTAPSDGRLDVLFSDLSTTPEIEFVINSATLNQVGWVTVTGTHTCTGAPWGSSSLNLTQKVGRSLITGYASLEFSCNGAIHPWSVTIKGGSPFVGGKALVDGRVAAYNWFSQQNIATDYLRSITLKGSRANR